MTATRSFCAAIVALVVLCVTPLPVMSDNVLSGMIERDYSPQADSLTTVLVRKFMNPSKGTFWAVPNNQPNRESETTYIYWQQAHAMDVLVYAYERTKDTNPNQAETYKRSIGLWYKNHANNWYHDSNDATGFLNTYTDDMCWICLTLLHIADALDDEQYAQTARTVFDSYIAPRGWADGNGFWGLPWKLDDRGRNACTNAPGCLVACKLYERYADEYYRQVAIDIYNYQANEMKTKLNNDGRVEDPPLTYTQGTFGEACRHLFHITGDDAYMTMATKVIHYLCTSTVYGPKHLQGRCCSLHRQYGTRRGCAVDLSSRVHALLAKQCQEALGQPQFGQVPRHLLQLLLGRARRRVGSALDGGDGQRLLVDGEYGSCGPPFAWRRVGYSSC